MTTATATKTPAPKTEKKPTASKANGKTEAKLPKINTTKKTVRIRALEVLAKKGTALPETAIRAAIGLSHPLKSTLDETVKLGFLRYGPEAEGSRGRTYDLTAAGRKLLESFKKK